MSQVSNAPESKDEKKQAKGTSEVVQKTDWGKKIKEYSLTACNSVKNFAMQIFVTVVAIYIFALVCSYFGLSFMGGLLLFGGVALAFWGLSKVLDGSAAQEISKVQTKLATPKAA